MARAEVNQLQSSDSLFSKRALEIGFCLLPMSFGPTVFGIRLTFIIAASLILLACVQNPIIHKTKIGRSQLLGLSAFFLSALIAVISSPLGDANFAQGLNWLLLTGGCVFLAYFVKRSFSDPTDALLKGLVLLGVFDSIVVLVSIAVEQGGFLSSTRQKSYLFEYYLQDAFFCSLAAIICFSAAAWNKTGRERAWLISGGVLCLAAMIVLASRGALLGFVAGLAFTLIILAKRGRGARAYVSWIFGISGLLSVFLMTPAGNQVLSRVQATDSSEIVNSLRRFAFQNLAYATALENPLGLGWNGFASITSSALSEPVRSAHSMYLSLILDLGLLGAIAYLTLIFSVLKRSLSGNMPPKSIFLGSLMVAYLAVGFNDSPHVLPIGMGISLIILLTFSEESLEKSR